MPSKKLVERKAHGQPVYVAAHVCQASSSKTLEGGVVLSRGRVSLVAPGADVARRDEELDVDVCLPAVMEVEDIYAKTASRLVRAVVEGRSASLVGLGSSSSGKSYTLFGSRQVQGLAHVCASGIVTSLQQRKDEVAKVLRDAHGSIGIKDGIVGSSSLGASRSANANGNATMNNGSSISNASSLHYEYLVETSVLEVYKEEVHDLYDDGAVKPVVDDEMDGPCVYDCVWVPANLTNGSQDMLAHITNAVSQRETARADVGRINDRSSLVLTFRVSQRVPEVFLHALSSGSSEGRVYKDETTFVSTLRVIDTPSSDRLTKDPEVLRLREGLTWNKSLLALSRLLSGLAAAKDATEAGITTAEAMRSSVLTRLLVDDIAGPCVCSSVLFFSPGDYASNCATLSLGRSFVRIGLCCPYARDDFARMAIARQRSIAAVAMDAMESAARVAMETAPSSGGHGGGGGSGAGQAQAQAQGLGSQGASSLSGRMKVMGSSQLPLIEKKLAMEESAAAVARVHEMEGLLLQERERVASMEEERRRQRQLIAQREEAEETSLQAREELQEELLRSEEKRLEVSKALIDLQLEHTQMQEELEETRYRLEKRIIELEAGQLAQDAESKMHEERQGNLELVAKELSDENATVREQMQRVKEDLERELGAVKTALAEAEGAREALQRALDEYEGQTTSLQAQIDKQQDLANAKANTEKDLPELSAQRLALERALSEKSAELSSSRKDVESLRTECATLQVQLQDARGTYQTRIEGCLQNVSELAAVANLSAIDPESPALDLNIFKESVSQLIGEVSHERLQRDKQYSSQLESLHRAYTSLRRMHAALLTGYRTLRYQAEDAVAAAGVETGNAFVHEDEILGAILKTSLPVAEHAHTGAGNTHAGVGAEYSQENAAVPGKMTDQSTVTMKEAMGPSDPADMHGEVVGLREKCIHLQQKLYTASVQQGLNAYGETHTNALSKVHEENEQLKAELERLRVSKATDAAEEELTRLKAETELLRSRLKEVEDMDKTRASIGYELAEVRKELERIQSGSGSGGGGSGVSEEEIARMEAEFKEYMSSMGAEYQTEITTLKAEKIELEERAAASEEYMASSTVAYQKEIMRLRALLAEHAPATLQ